MQVQKKKLARSIFVRGFVTFLIIGFVFALHQTPAFAKVGAQGYPGSFAELIKKASPSVVNIIAVKVMRTPDQGGSPFGMEDPLRDFFERFFGGQLPKEYRQNALGTGFIIDKEGFILTNNHVVEQTEELKVRLSDEKEYNAKIIGRDPKTDLALIKIDAQKPLTPLVLGDSDSLEVGDWVVAIGNPFGLGNTVTAGIVSAKYRQIGGGPYDNFIQTDASINPGNSGGPLLDLDGEVIGVNSAIFSQSGGNIGIGFAIPINMAKQLLPQLRKGKVSRSWLGVMIQNITPELKEKLGLGTEEGALVSDVVSGGPADKAGMKRGDVILRFDDKAIRSSRDLPFVVASTPIGKTVTVEVIRDSQQINLQVKTEELKEEADAAPPDEARPYLGMQVQEITPEMAKNYGLSRTSGVIIVEVESGSPAAEAGLVPGDIIVEIDKKPVSDVKSFNRLLAGIKEGDTLLFLIDRGGTTIFVTLSVKK
ncbi:MAG: DegQ family serine endoprotease [Desulfobacterales bacterium]|nr:MAG: DegQ family serine endoprotease [Desulfobacterales bacterium]